MEIIVEAEVNINAASCLSCDYFCVECEQKG